jgi:hypothetical protein
MHESFTIHIHRPQDGNANWRTLDCKNSTLKMEAICFSVTSVDFRRITWRCIPEDRTLDNHSWANLKSYSSNTRKIEEFDVKKNVAQSFSEICGDDFKNY